MAVHPSSTITIHRPTSAGGVSDDDDVSTLSGSEANSCPSHVDDRRNCRSSPKSNRKASTNRSSSRSRLQSYLGGTKKFINANSAHKVPPEKSIPKTIKMQNPYRFQMGINYNHKVKQYKGESDKASPHCDKWVVQEDGSVEQVMKNDEKEKSHEENVHTPISRRSGRCSDDDQETDAVSNRSEMSYASSRLSRMSSSSVRKQRLERLRRKRLIAVKGTEDSVDSSPLYSEYLRKDKKEANSSSQPVQRDLHFSKNLRVKKHGRSDAASTATGESGTGTIFSQRELSSCKCVDIIDEVVEASARKFEQSQSEETIEKRLEKRSCNSTMALNESKVAMENEVTLPEPPSHLLSPPPLSSRKAVYMRSLHKDENRPKKTRPLPRPIFIPPESSPISPPKVTRRYENSSKHTDEPQLNPPSEVDRLPHTKPISTFSPIDDLDENVLPTAPSEKILDSNTSKPTEASLVTPKPIRPKYLHRSFWSVPASNPDYFPSPANTRSTASSTIFNSPAYTHSSEIEDTRFKILGFRTAETPEVTHSKRPTARKSPVKRVDDLYQSMVEKFHSDSPVIKADDGNKKEEKVGNATPCSLAALEPPALKRVVGDDEVSITVSSNASWSSFISEEIDDLSSKGSAFRKIRRRGKRSEPIFVKKNPIKSYQSCQDVSDVNFSPTVFERNSDDAAEHVNDGSTVTTTPTSTNGEKSMASSRKQNDSVAEIDIDMTGRSKPEVYDIFSEIERDLKKVGMRVKINVINKDVRDTQESGTFQTNSSTRFGSCMAAEMAAEMPTEENVLKKKNKKGHVKHFNLSTTDYSGLLPHYAERIPEMDPIAKKHSDDWMLGSKQQKRNWMPRRKLPPKASSSHNILSDNTPVLLSKIRFATKKVLRRSKEDQDHLLHDKYNRSESDKPNLAEEQGELMWFQN